MSYPPLVALQKKERSDDSKPMDSYVFEEDAQSCCSMPMDLVDIGNFGKPPFVFCARMPPMFAGWLWC